MLQLGMYASPVGYATTLIPEKWKWLYYLNPLAGLIDAFRWSILGKNLYWPSLVYSLVLTVTILAFGLWFFRRQEARFADDI